MITVESSRIVGAPWWYLRRYVAWTDHCGADRPRLFGPRRITRAGAERALWNLTERVAAEET